MTNMKRMSVVLPPEIEKEILKMKQSEQYSKCSLAEIIRILLRLGITSEQNPPA